MNNQPETDNTDKTWGDTFNEWVDYFGSFFYNSNAKTAENMTLQQLEIYFVACDHRLREYGKKEF